MKQFDVIYFKVQSHNNNKKLEILFVMNLLTLCNKSR